MDNGLEKRMNIESHSVHWVNTVLSSLFQRAEDNTSRNGWAITRALRNGTQRQVHGWDRGGTDGIKMTLNRSCHGMKLFLLFYGIPSVAFLTSFFTSTIKVSVHQSCWFLSVSKVLLTTSGTKRATLSHVNTLPTGCRGDWMTQNTILTVRCNFPL